MDLTGLDWTGLAKYAWLWLDSTQVNKPLVIGLIEQMQCNAMIPWMDGASIIEDTICFYNTFIYVFCRVCGVARIFTRGFVRYLVLSKTHYGTMRRGKRRRSSDGDDDDDVEAVWASSGLGGVLWRVLNDFNEGSTDRRAGLEWIVGSRAFMRWDDIIE